MILLLSMQNSIVKKKYYNISIFIIVFYLSVLYLEDPSTQPTLLLLIIYHIRGEYTMFIYRNYLSSSLINNRIREYHR